MRCAADVTIQVATQSDWVVADCSGLQVGLNKSLTPELRREGLAQDVTRHVQQIRKEKNLNIEDHIEVTYQTGDEELEQAIEEWKDPKPEHDWCIKSETLCDNLESGQIRPDAKEVDLGGR